MGRQAYMVNKTQAESQDDKSFPTDGHQAILNKAYKIRQLTEADKCHNRSNASERSVMVGCIVVLRPFDAF